MRIFKIILNILLISFFLNFAWEYLQSPFYNSFANSLRNNYIHYILSILWDSLYTLIIYSITSIMTKDFEWILHHWNTKNILITVLIWLLIAIFIEYKWVFILHKWNYSELMPTILGIWIIPILQMLLLPILSFRLTKKLICSL